MTKTDVEHKEGNEPRMYELGYLLVPTIAEDDTGAQVEALRNIIEAEGGRIFSEGNPKIQELAYTISVDIKNKRYSYDKGYFGWIKFEADPISVDAIQAKLDTLGTMIRHLITKTVREEGSNHIDLRLLPKLETEEKRPSRRPGVVSRSTSAPKIAATPDVADELDAEATEAPAASEADIDEAIDKLVEEDEEETK